MTNGIITFFVRVPAELIEHAAPLIPADRKALRAYLKAQLCTAVDESAEGIQHMIDEASA